jgi:multiple sugar transport system ATP-binding protein
MSMGDKVGVLNAGRIVQVGTPQDIYNHPRDTFVAGFVGSPASISIEGELRNGRASAMAGKLEIPLNGAAATKAPGAEGTCDAGHPLRRHRVGPNEAVEARVHDVEITASRRS